MEPSDYNSVFYNENIARVNKLFQKFFYFTFLFPIIMFFAARKSLIEVSDLIVAITICIVLLFNIIEFLLNRLKNMQVFSMYFGLIGCMAIVSYVGAVGLISVYISYIFVPMLSTLYLNISLTNCVSFLNYLGMELSLWFRSATLLLIASKNGEMYSQHKIFLLLTITFTFEYAFSYVVGIALAKRSFKMLNERSSTIREENAVYEKLEESTKLLSLAHTKQLEYNSQIQMNQFKTIEFVAEVLGSHDLFTGNHISHTRTYVVIIAEQLRSNGYYTDVLSDKTIKLYSTAAFLHDIGKVHIPEAILNKPGKFTPEEFELMKSHPAEGLKLLSYLPQIDDGSFNEIAKEVAYYHHEKWDGTGYPVHIIGTEIPISARIMAAADVLDALISQRLYKMPMSMDEAMQVFAEDDGHHFEPCIAEAVIDARKKIEDADIEFKRHEYSKNASELEWWHKYHMSHGMEH